MRKGLLVCALVLLSPGSASATPGDLDPASRDGFVKVGLKSAFQSGQIAVESDGRILVATTARGGGLGSGSFLLSRFRLSGKPDRSFSGDGTVVPALGSASARIADLAIDPQGRALVAADGGDFVVARFLATGEPDPGFAGDGVAELDLGASETVEALAVQPDGAILVGGRSGGRRHRAAGAGPADHRRCPGRRVLHRRHAADRSRAVAVRGRQRGRGRGRWVHLRRERARQPTGFDPNDGIVARYEPTGTSTRASRTAALRASTAASPRSSRGSGSIPVGGRWSPGT